MRTKPREIKPKRETDALPQEIKPKQETDAKEDPLQNANEARAAEAKTQGVGEGKRDVGKERVERLQIGDSLEDIGKGDQKEGDERGHVIGDQFDGSNGLENMIPQNAELNRGDFKKLENQLAQEVKDGKQVRVEIKMVYEGDSRRPSQIRVIYSINGTIGTRTFRNK